MKEWVCSTAVLVLNYGVAVFYKLAESNILEFLSTGNSRVSVKTCIASFTLISSFVPIRFENKLK